MKKITLSCLLLISTFSLAACGNNNYGLNAKNPTAITLWNYYNNALKTNFDNLVRKFNSSVGTKKGIVVNVESFSSISEIEKNLKDSIDGVLNAKALPNICQAYADTALYAHNKDLLVNISDYLSDKELDEYVESFIDEGILKDSNAISIFPVAKSSETLVVNMTEFNRFTAANPTFDESYFKTMDSLVYMSQAYYDWSGKSFFGRDAFANYMISGMKQLGSNIFSRENGDVVYNIDKIKIKSLWDAFYIPYINGAFYEKNSFRSDDMAVGDIVAYVGSTTSALFIPKNVTIGSQVTSIETKTFAVPAFMNNQQDILIQQGAGMVVTNSENKAQEYASVVFLKWLTEIENNIEFSVSSGYLPVKKEALNKSKIQSTIESKNMEIDEKIADVIYSVLDQLADGAEFYTTPSFDEGVEARRILNTSMINIAKTNRANILESDNYQEALATYSSQTVFDAWYNNFSTALNSL